MKDINSQAVVQQNVLHPNFAQEDDYGMEEGSEDFTVKQNVITGDDLMEIDQADTKSDNYEDQNEDDEGQELFRQQFLAEWKRRERQAA